MTTYLATARRILSPSEEVSPREVEALARALLADPGASSAERRTAARILDPRQVVGEAAVYNLARAIAARVRAAARGVPVRSEARDDRRLDKRYCQTGRFAPSLLRSNACGLLPRRGAPADPFRAVAGERLDRVCYSSRGPMVRAFVGANLHITEAWGLRTVASAGEFDAINERHGLKGKRRATTLAGAILAATPPGRPYCLDRVDLDALNETRPGQDLGPFRLPDIAVERAQWEAYEEAGAGASDVPF